MIIIRFVQLNICRIKQCITMIILCNATMMTATTTTTATASNHCHHADAQMTNEFDSMLIMIIIMMKTEENTFVANNVERLDDVCRPTYIYIHVCLLIASLALFRQSQQAPVAIRYAYIIYIYLFDAHNAERTMAMGH